MKNVYEVMDEFLKATNKEERIQVLRRNHTGPFESFLVGVFHPAIQFPEALKKVEFKRDDIPAGMAYVNFQSEARRMYLYVKDHKNAPHGLTDERRVVLFTQMLEGMEPREGDMMMRLVNKDLKIPYLTPKLVEEAYPHVDLGLKKAEPEVEEFPATS